MRPLRFSWLRPLHQRVLALISVRWKVDVSDSATAFGQVIINAISDAAFALNVMALSMGH